MAQDSIDVFQNPVDSVRVAAQDVTSEKITHLLDFSESMQAFWNLIVPEYLFFVCVSYYIVVTRIPAISTNAKWKRNAWMGILTVVWGIIEYFWREFSLLNLLVTGMGMNFGRENIFKWIFAGLEKIGWLPLPEWHVEEIKEEKLKDIERAEQVKKQNNNP